MKELGDIDGKNMWNAISENTETPRKEMVYNIDEIYNYAAVRQGNWKYIAGTSTSQNLWYGDAGKSNSYKYDINDVLKSETAITLAGLLTYKQIAEKNTDSDNTTHLLEPEIVLKLRKLAEIKCPPMDVTEQQKCKPLESPCVFNIKDDPCERINLAQTYPEILNNLQKLVEKYRKSAVKPRNIPRDPNADPAFYNNTWTNWRDWDDVLKQKISSEKSLSPLAIGLISAACFAVLLAIIILVGVRVRMAPKSNRSFTLGEDSAVDPATVEMAPKVQMFEDRELQQMRSSFKDCGKSVE